MDDIEEPKTDQRKPYEKPAVIHELELETKAGSPTTGVLPDLDPLALPDDKR